MLLFYDVIMCAVWKENVKSMNDLEDAGANKLSNDQLAELFLVIAFKLCDFVVFEEKYYITTRRHY